MIDHIVVAVVDATAVHPGAKLLEDGLIEGLAFGDIEVRHPVAADIVEVACGKRTGGLYRAVEAAAPRTCGGILRTEPAQRAEGRQAAAMRAGEPQQEVDVVAAFGQQDRIRLPLAAENPAHVAVRGTVEAHGSGMVDRDDLPQLARGDYLADLGKIGMVAQHMAHTDHHAPFAGTAGDFAALFEVLGDRLFEQDVVSRVDGLDRRVEMDVLGGRDQHHVGFDAIGEEVVVMRIAPAGRQSEIPREGMAAQVVYIDDGDGLQPVGIPAGIFEVLIGPVPGSYHHNPHGAGNGRFVFHRNPPKGYIGRRHNSHGRGSISVRGGSAAARHARQVTSFGIGCGAFRAVPWSPVRKEIRTGGGPGGCYLRPAPRPSTRRLRNWMPAPWPSRPIWPDLLKSPGWLRWSTV